MLAILKTTAGKYLVGAILAVFIAMAVGLATLWHLNAAKARSVAQLKQENSTLQQDLDEERAWAQKLSEEAARNTAAKNTNKQTEDQATERLGKAYESNKDWSDAPVPGDVTDGLRDFLQTR